MENTFCPIVDSVRKIFPVSPSPEEVPPPSPSQPTPDTPNKPPCKCTLNAGTPCYLQFSGSVLQDTRLHYQGMVHDELDLIILSKLECTIHLSSETCRPKQKTQTKRQRTRNDYFHHGHRICRDLFMYLHGIAKGKLDVLIAHFKSNGVEPRVHKNKKKLPSKTLSLSDVQQVVTFIVNYADLHAITLPGRTPHHWVSDVKLLPTNCTKRKVYTDYCAASDFTTCRKVAERTFRDLWQKLVPYITTMKPATDLCFTCQQGLAKVNRSANLPDEAKSLAIKEMEKHLLTVTQERSLYQTVCHESKENLPPTATLGQHEPCSFNGLVHYSFDFAQQLMFPSNPLQPGPIYFKVPRRCGLFGVNCESLTRQVNFLIDEEFNVGKGANCVISLLHFFFENFGLGETHLHLHADNCSGQNKNSAMIWYLLWRIITGQHSAITLSFLVTGHTKFSPDCGFGLIKRLFKKTKVNTLNDITDVVNSSSVMNSAQLCGNQEGDVIVPMFDWTSHLSQFFTKLIGIKKFHHFRFSSTGSVYTKEFSSDSEETVHSLLKVRLPLSTESPPRIHPTGLTLQRQRYLFNEIRPFVEEPFKDIVAPQPVQDQTNDRTLDLVVPTAKRAKN